MNFLFILSIDLKIEGPSVHLLRDIMKSIVNNGHTITILSKSSKLSANDIFSNNQFDKQLKSYCINSGKKKKKNFVGRYIDEINYAKACAKVYKEMTDIDVVFLQSTTVGFFHTKPLKKYVKKPIVFNVQDIFPYNLYYSNQLPFSRVTFSLFRKLQHKAYLQSDRIITISHDMKNTLIADGVPESKIDVVYNWSYSDQTIKLEDLESNRIKNIMMDNEKFNVVYAGNIGKMQNVEVIVRAAQLCNEDDGIHFFIIGDGANKKKIIEMSKELKNISILPMQKSKYAESIYAQADINIIPLNKGGIFTALPSKTATCLRANVPIVFCIDKKSEFQSIVEEDNKICVVDSDDEKELKEAILLLKNCKNKNSCHNPIFLSYFSKKNADKYAKILITTG